MMTERTKFMENVSAARSLSVRRHSALLKLKTPKYSPRVAAN